MIDYAPFTPAQADYLRRSMQADIWLNVLEGGKRAGKNVLNVIAFCENLMTHPERLHLAAGVSRPAAGMNIVDCNGFGVAHFFGGLCRAGSYNGNACYHLQTPAGPKVLLLAGGRDADDYRSIKGLSLGSVYITEANECHESFVRECFDRTLASRRRKLFLDLNAKSPRHWFYTGLLDFWVGAAPQSAAGRTVQRAKRSNYAHLTIWDNLAVDDARLEKELATYDKGSLWYQADILGRRTAASGRVYPGFGGRNVLPEEALAALAPQRFSIGVDVGGTDATVATLVGFTGGFERAVLLDGYYHRQGKNSGMTHALYAEAIADALEGWVDRWPQVAAATVFAESADKLFRQALLGELRRRGFGRMAVVPAYKKEGIVDRIRLQNILISQGRFLVAAHLGHWLEAYGQAVWSDADFEKGSWVRVDDGSCPVDCLDSSEYAVQPFKAQLLQGAGAAGRDGCGGG